jgi:hypothetical protein
MKPNMDTIRAIRLFVAHLKKLRIHREDAKSAKILRGFLRALGVFAAQMGFFSGSHSRHSR